MGSKETAAKFEPKSGAKTPSKGGTKSSNTTNATTKKAENMAEKTDTKSPSSLSWFTSILIAISSLTAGVFTPPILSLWNIKIDSTSAQSENDRTLAGSKFTNLPALPSRVICNEETLSQFLHQSPVHGLHVVCFDQIIDSSSASTAATIHADGSVSESRSIDEENEKIQVTMYLDAYQDHNDPSDGPYRITISKKNFRWATLKRALSKEMELEPPGPMQQPWAMFTTKGERIVSVDDHVTTNDFSSVKSEQYVLESILASNTIVLTEGGQWIWPGVEVGFKREVDLYSIMPAGDQSSLGNRTSVVLETISLEPLVLSVHNFLSNEECDHIRKRSEPKMEYSEVKLKDDDIGKEASNWRTSQNTFLSSYGDKVMEDLEYRTASLTRISRDHQEHLQVLRYGNTEFYSAHHDYFDPDHYSKDEGTLELIQHGKRNRLATVFWYLSTVEEGGETIFPMHNGAPGPRNPKDCTKGLKVKPEKGKVIIFYSLDAAGDRDELSLHGACPVEKGIKWAANKWVWNDAMGFI